MSFNRTVKYFKSIKAYVYCDICKEVISMDINKEDIRNGLQTGLYVYKYKHTNPNPDPDIPEEEDPSRKEHTIAVYINSDYEVKGIKCYSEETGPAFEEGTKIPIREKEIPPMSVHLGMLSPEEYRIIQICDGTNTLEDVAKIAGIDMNELMKMINKLREKGLISLITRR